MNNNIKYFYLFLPFSIIIIFIFAFLYFNHILLKKNIYPKESILIINKGSNIKEIANNLEKKGLIKNSKFFVFYINFIGKSSVFKAGEYKINAYSSIKNIIDILISGKSIEYSLTIPEGTSVRKIFNLIKNNELLSGDLPSKLIDEGWLITDTIRFVRGTSRKKIIKQLNELQINLVNKIWNNRSNNIPIYNINEFLTIASIIEKETNLSSEKPHIASVFYNRLRKKMRLQSDPTVLYGIFMGAEKPINRPIFRSDLKKNNPFNTYKIFGLPPYPISNPGKDALFAAANPKKTDDLYFVADGKGGHIFSKTFKEHMIYVKKWRKLKNIKEIYNKKFDT